MDPNTLYLDPDQKVRHNLDPDSNIFTQLNDQIHFFSLQFFLSKASFRNIYKNMVSSEVQPYLYNVFLIAWIRIRNWNTDPDCCIRNQFGKGLY